MPWTSKGRQGAVLVVLKATLKFDAKQAYQKCPKGWWKLPAASWGRGGGRLIPEVRGTRGSLPEGTSQPDDPGGVGGLYIMRIYQNKISYNQYTEPFVQLSPIYSAPRD